MDRVSILQFRRQAEATIPQVQQGKRFIVTYRGKPVMRLEPIREPQVGADDPFYSLDQLAVSGGEALTNEEIDQIIYQD